MHVVVMAGGLGSRLRPLTAQVPKPLLPVAGRPMLEHILLLLRAHGFADATITVQYLATVIRSYMGDGTDIGVTVHYAAEHRPLGTAGGVKSAMRSRNEPVLVMSGDAVTDIDLSALVDAHHGSGAALTMCLARRSDPREFGLAHVREDGRVERFLEKPGWGEVFTDTVSTGIYVVGSEVLAEIPDDEPWDFSRQVIPGLLAAGTPVHGHVAHGYWEDVGDLDAYRRVQIDALDGRVSISIPGREVSPRVWVGDGVEISALASISGPAFIGSHSVIEAGVDISDHCIVGANAIIKTDAVLERCTLLEGAYVAPDVQLRGCIVGRNVDIGSGSRVGDLAVVADDCSLEQEVDVAAGSLVFPGKRIESGSRVVGSVMWDSQGRGRLMAGGRLAGILGVDLTPELLVGLASAWASTLPKQAVVSATRDSSRAAAAVEELMIGALTAGGLAVRDLGSVPIPVARYDVATKADAGVVVRRSTLSEDDLEILLLGADGRPLSESSARQIERIYERREFRRSLPSEIGERRQAPECISDYARHVVAGGPLTNVEGSGLTVAVDAGRGVTGLVLPTILHGSDIDLVLLGSKHDDRMDSSKGDAVASPLVQLSERVVATGAHLGIWLDPSGERLRLVDEQGTALDEDRTLLVVLDLVAAEARSGIAVLPATASRVAERVAEFHGFTVMRVADPREQPVGDGVVFIADAAGGFAIAGASAHLDGIATATALMGLVARTRLSLSAIDARIPRTTLERSRIEVPWSQRAGIMRRVYEEAARFDPDLTWGVRVAEHDGSWFLVAPDAGEARILLWAEAESPARATEVMARATSLVHEARREVEAEPVGP